MSCAERGHSVLFVLILTPLFAALGMFAVDLAEYHRRGAELQSAADRIALNAAPLFPREASVREYLARSAISLNEVGTTLTAEQVDASAGTVRVSLRAVLADTFLSFLFRRPLIELERHSTAGIVPGDYILILSDGSSLRPGLRHIPLSDNVELDPSWGDEREWPASALFHRCAVRPADLGPGFERWATQACFNPALSALKLSALTLVDFWSTVAENRLALLYTPGLPRSRGFSTAMPLVKLSAGSQPAVDWNPYREPLTRLGDESCVLFSAPLLAGRRYALFEGPDGKITSSCSMPVLGSSCRGGNLLTDSTSFLTPCYFNGTVPLREGIFWHVPQFDENFTPHRPDLVPAIRAGIAELQHGLLTESEDADLRRAGGKRALVVITDDVPSSPMETISEIRLQLAELYASLHLLFFVHESMSGVRAAASEEALRTWENTSTSTLPTARDAVTVWRASSPGDLLERVTPQVLAATRVTVLRE